MSAVLAKRALGTGLLLVAVASTGCSREAGATAPPAAPVVATYPAAAAGGACGVLDYETIHRALGVRFDIAAASRHEQTSTCVVQAKDAARPDLMLSITGTGADATVLSEDIAPDGAKTVRGLGKAAYRAIRPATKGAGPAAEVAWLTGDKKLVTLSYTLPAGQPEAAADASVEKLLTLAKALAKALPKTAATVSG